jgi:acetyl-CoA carboxylase biotin carboxyl carrier protein
MGGKILKVLVRVGDMVKEEQEVVILEAMKMELPIIAEGDGEVKAIYVQPGEPVEIGAAMMLIE